MQFTTTEIISNMQTYSNAVSIDVNFSKEQKDIVLEELNKEKEKLIISNDAYAICVLLENLKVKINRLKW